MYIKKNKVKPLQEGNLPQHKLKKVASFLKEFKEIAIIKGVFVIPRQINNIALEELGLTKVNREAIILSLTPKNFCSGPEADRDQPGELWFFGKTIDNREVYIKLKIAIVGSCKIAKCLSFHKADYKLNYYE